MTTGQAVSTRWGAVVAVGVAVVLLALDMTIVAVALPVLSLELGVTVAATQWVLLGYFLPLVALSIPAGRWLDRARLRPAFLLAVIGFGVASLLATLAPNFGALVAARGLQGAFGALIGVIGFPIVAAVVAPEHRGRAMSVLLTLIPLSGVAGPVAGGLLTAAFGWRSVFLVNVPIIVGAAWLGWRTLPSGPAGRAVLPWPDARSLREALFLGAAATAVFLGLDLLGRGSGGVLVPAVLGAIAVAAATAWTRLPESVSILGLLRRPGLAAPLAGLPLMTTVVGATNFLVPYFVVTVLGRSLEMGGLVLAALAATMAVTSPLAGVLTDRIGTRIPTLAGSVAVLAGVLALLAVDAGTSPVALAWPLAVIGIGQGLFAGPNSAAVLAATPRELAATAGGVTAVLRTLGFSLGPALAALSWAVAGNGPAGFTAAAAVLVGVAAAAVLVTWTRRLSGPVR